MRLFRRIPRRRFECIQVNVPLRSEEMKRSMKKAYLPSCGCSCFFSSAQAHRYLVAGKGAKSRLISDPQADFAGKRIRDGECQTTMKRSRYVEKKKRDGSAQGLR